MSRMTSQTASFTRRPAKCRLWIGERTAVVSTRIVWRLLIQSGQRHYSEMLSPESLPSERYLHVFRQACAANLQRMAGEEVMCYALGRIVAQVNRVCYAAGAFK